MRAARPLHRLTRLPRTVSVFCAERFPAPYGLYALLWAGAAESGATVLAAGHRWRPDRSTTARTAGLLLAALSLRMIDDLKDLRHDRMHHPDRPVPAGRIDTADLVVAAAGSAVGATALFGVVGGPWAVGGVTASLGLGLLHWAAVHRGMDLGTRPWLELAGTYPIQILLSAALFTSTARRTPIADPRALASLLSVFAGAFLPYEIGRKTCARAPGPAQRGHYTATMPLALCLALLSALSVTAVITWNRLARRKGVLPTSPTGRRAFVGGATALTALPLAAVVPVARGRRDAPSEAPTALFIIGLYLHIICTNLTAEKP